MKYEEKDIPKFQEEVCKNNCIMGGKCIDEEKDNHWYLMCPHYFNWKLGYISFTSEQLRWQREHPEELEKEHKKNIELAKKIRSTKSKKK